MKEELQYPVDSFIIWCDEYYKVCINNSDYAGIVKDMNGDKANFYFNFGGEKARKITDLNLIKELQDILDKKELKYRYCPICKHKTLEKNNIIDNYRCLECGNCFSKKDLEDN